MYFTLVASVHIFGSEEPEVQLRSGDLVEVDSPQPPPSNLVEQFLSGIYVREC